MFSSLDQPLTQHDLDAVLAFLPIFEDKAHVAGELTPFERLDEHTLALPRASYSREVFDFERALYEHRWIVKFDWGEWGHGEGNHYFRSTEDIASAPLDDLRRVLTAISRQDRFIEGGLLSHFESGLIVAVLRRIREFRCSWPKMPTS